MSNVQKICLHLPKISNLRHTKKSYQIVPNRAKTCQNVPKRACMCIMHVLARFGTIFSITQFWDFSHIKAHLYMFPQVLARFGTYRHVSARFGTFRHVSARIGTIVTMTRFWDFWHINAHSGTFWHFYEFENVPKLKSSKKNWNYEFETVPKLQFRKRTEITSSKT